MTFVFQTSFCRGNYLFHAVLSNGVHVCDAVCWALCVDISSVDNLGGGSNQWKRLEGVHQVQYTTGGNFQVWPHIGVPTCQSL